MDPTGQKLESSDGRASAIGAPMRVGTLDRDSGFVVVLARRLGDIGWEHSLLPRGITPKALAELELDVLVVDLSLLRKQRWSWLRRLCDLRGDMSIVVCTASSTVAERVLSLRLGVDDWVTKPCHPGELVARLEAITAYRRRDRQREARSADPINVGELELRPQRYQAFVDGRGVGLSTREYQLLELLARSEEVLSREAIYEALWGRKLAPNGRSVDVCVHKLRRKLELASPGWRYIETRYAIGYRLAPGPRGEQRPCALPRCTAIESSLAA